MPPKKSHKGLKDFVKSLKMAIEVSLDPVLIVDTEMRIIYFNTAFKALTQLTRRELATGTDFLKLIRFGGGVQSQRMRNVVEKSEVMRLDEAPAEVGKRKIRVTMKAVPVFDPDDPEKEPIGALVAIRETTGEVLVQAKYHKIRQLLEEKDLAIDDLRDQLHRLRDSYRRKGTQ